MDLRLDFSLQRSALISWSGWFWNRPDIKDKIKYLIDHGDLENLHHKESIRDLVDVAKGYLKAVDMPRRLYDRLVETIITLGLRATYWYHITCSEYVLYSEYTQAVYVFIPFGYTRALHWTAFGTLDEAKIVENSWIERLETLQNEEQMCDIYYMACASILNDFISSNAEKMLDNAELARSRSALPESAGDKKWNFIACSVLTLASFEQFSEEKKIELTSKYFTALNGRKEAYMFSMSVKNGHFIAARYYWQLLDSSEREEKIVEAARICMHTIHTCSSNPCPSFTDILVFLLSEGLGKSIKQFFAPHYWGLPLLEFPIQILNILIRSYGWENFFFSAFDQFRKVITDHFEYYCVLKCIIDTLYERRMMGLDSKNTIYHQMLSVLLSDSDFDRIFDRNLPSKKNANLLWKVFYLFDLDVINMILDKYSNCRISFLKKGKTQYEKLIRDKKCNLLREFMEIVLRSEDEREWFRSCLVDYIYTFIRKDEFHLADNLLNVLGSSEEERKRIKHRMDFLSFTAEFFIKNNLKFAQKILNWGFSDEKEKHEYFDTFKCPGLIYWGNEIPRRSHFLIIFWKKDIDTNHFILSLSEFLNWFFGCENANYKISKIFSEKLLRKFFKAIYDMEVEHKRKCLFARKAFDTIDKLIKVYVPLEDIAKLRTEIIQNACEWLTECVFVKLGRRCQLSRWVPLNSFLDWVLEDKEGNLDYEKKREFVKNLLLTRDGLVLFKLIVSRLHKCLDYFCSWIKWAGGISKIEHLLDEMGLLSDDSKYFQENFQCLKQMCEQRGYM